MKDRSKEKKVTLINGGHKVTVPASLAPLKITRGYKIVEEKIKAKKAGGDE